MSVRAAGKLLLQRFGIRRGFRPDWRQARLLERMSSRSEVFAAFRRSSDLPALSVVALFARQRSTPKFFVDPSVIPRLASEVEREHPSWKSGSIRRVRQDCEEGLRLYDRRGPVLGRDFPWGSIESGPGGDKLYRKRPHRFAFAPRLALAALYGERSDAVLRDLLTGWMSYAASAENALAYDSNLAVIQRVLALSWTWAFLAARENPTSEDLSLEGMVLEVLHADAEFLAPRLGDSHPNNHLLADAFAGWFLSVVWPELIESGDWRERFEAIWLREIGRQTLADGTSFEHSTHYHEYACEMSTAYVILSRRNGLAVPDWVLARTRSLLEFQAALGDRDAHTVAIGDAAEDPLFPLDSGDGWATAAWRDLLRLLFSIDSLPAENDPPSRERSFWLLGAAAPSAPPRAALDRLESYPSGGYYIFRDGALDSSLVFRSGPNSAEAVSPGHMHADLMSVYAKVMGIPFIVDAGTFTYRRRSEKWPLDEPDWRTYFSGPLAHNALAIEGHDPLGTLQGDFRTELLSFASTERAIRDPSTSWVDAVLEGQGVYAGYRRGVLHVPGEYWILYDVFPRPVPGHGRSLGFQLAPECDVDSLDERRVAIQRDGTMLCLTGSPGLLPAVVTRGSRRPTGGWVSRGYGQLLPAPQVRFAVGDETAATAFLLRPAVERLRNDDAAIEVETLETGGLRLRVAIGNVEDTLLLNFGSPDIELCSKGVNFRGGLLRLRARSTKPETLHWLNGRSFAWPERGLLVESVQEVPTLRVDTVENVEGSARPSLRSGLSIQWPK